MSRFPARNALPAELRIKLRACVRRHNLRVLTMGALLLPCMWLVVQIPRQHPVAIITMLMLLLNLLLLMPPLSKLSVTL